LLTVARLVSQPLVRLLSQLAKPALQLMSHAPALQDGVPLLELHTLLQLPQRVASVFRFVSQPLARLPSQLPNPALQVI
jgi:hypothetical protein